MRRASTTPSWRLLADDEDVTATLADRLVRLRLTDEAGIRSDTLEVTLDDRAPHIAVPRTGAELSLALGYLGGTLLPMGRFVADEVELSSPPATLVVRARAANFSAAATRSGRATSLQEARTRSWHATTYGAIVSAIAQTAGYSVRMAAALADQVVEHIDQIDESDLSLLTRLAGDALAKPAGGAIIVAPRGAGLSGRGHTLPTVTLTPTDCTRWRLTRSERRSFGAVKAHWHDLGSAQPREVLVKTATGGTGTYRLRRAYPSAASASAAAHAASAAFGRAAANLHIEMAGDPRLATEGHIVLAGFRDGLAGTWSVTRAVHTLAAAGMTTSLDLEVVP